MPTSDWRYLFLPEQDMDPASRAPSLAIRTCKTLLWYAAAVLLGLLVGRAC